MEMYIKNECETSFLMKKEKHIVCVQIYGEYKHSITFQNTETYFTDEYESQMLPCDKNEFLEAYDKATEFIKNKIF